MVTQYRKALDTVFEWDEAKAESNLKKHGVSFENAVAAFSDPAALLAYDKEHSAAEDRFLLLGKVKDCLVLLVVFTEANTIRIISARRATRQEAKKYEQQ